MNYYPHHIGDYLRDTSHLTAVEDGIYRRLLDLYYASEKPLPLNISGLCRLARARRIEEKKAVDTILEEFFIRTEEGWRNPRADKEIIEWNDKSGKSKYAAGVRWKHADAMRTHSGRNANQSQSQSQSQSQRKEKAKLVAALPDWLPLEAWNSWLEVRTKNRAPNTTRALNLALRELDRLRGEGHDPTAVLENATVRGWRGLFPPPKAGASGDLSNLIREVEEEDKKRAAD